MKVIELYDLTKQIMFEKSSSTIYDEYLIGHVNRIITELFADNNIARAFHGKVPFTAIPFVSSKDDEIDFEDEYLYNVMPLGLAMYFMTDDDLNKRKIYEADYKNAIQQHKKIVSKSKLDAVSK